MAVIAFVAPIDLTFVMPIGFRGGYEDSEVAAMVEATSCQVNVTCWWAVPNRHPHGKGADGRQNCL